MRSRWLVPLAETGSICLKNVLDRTGWMNGAYGFIRRQPSEPSALLCLLRWWERLGVGHLAVWVVLPIQSMNTRETLHTSTPLAHFCYSHIFSLPPQPSSSSPPSQMSRQLLPEVDWDKVRHLALLLRLEPTSNPFPLPSRIIPHPTGSRCISRSSPLEWRCI